MNSNRIADLQKLLASDPAAEEFIELAELLCEHEEKRTEAREICFRGLTHHPRSARGRLVLARLFYLSGYPEFCFRELEILRNLTTSAAVGRLVSYFEEYRKFSIGNVAASAGKAAPGEPTAAKSPAAPTQLSKSIAVGDADALDDDEDFDVLAEIDIDSDFLDALDEIDGDIDKE